MLTSYLLTRSISYEVIIVEDNSPDGTLAVANKLRDVFGGDKIKILSRPGKLGLGSAYIDGLKLCNGDFIFLMDADMSHHPKHIAQFIKCVHSISPHGRAILISTLSLQKTERIKLRYSHRNSVRTWWWGKHDM